MTTSSSVDSQTSGSDVGVDVRPMSGCMGAEIFGVDISQPLDQETIGSIRAVLLKWKVVFFRDQSLDDAQHLAFGRQFGEVLADPVGLAPDPKFPEIFVLDNHGKTEGTLDLPGTTEARWHFDAGFVVTPPMGSILRAVIVPEYGGDTQFTNLVAAYESLSEPVRTLLDGLHAVNVNAVHLARGEALSEVKKVFLSKEQRVVHPVVRVHPETGEKGLFVNPMHTSHIVELTRQEGRHLLAMLFEHMSRPEFTVRFRWHEGSVAFWENRSCAHIVPTDIPEGARRRMHRITIVGDTPRGTDGALSYSLTGEGE
jgi:alpha-ketoglutarate-dependent taurine dioxygenase